MVTDLAAAKLVSEDGRLTIGGTCGSYCHTHGGGAIVGLVWSRDGSVVWTGHADGSLFGWSTRTGAAAWQHEWPGRRVQCLAPGPQHQELAVGLSDGQLLLVDGHRQPQVLTHFDHPVQDLVWSPQGRTLAVLAAPTAEAMGWLGVYGEDGARKRGGFAAQLPLAVSPDGRSIAMAQAGALAHAKLDPEAISRLQPHPDGGAEPRLAAYSPDGQRLVAHYRDGSLALFDVRQNRPLWHEPFERQARPHKVAALAFSSDGAHCYLFAGMVLSIDAATGSVVARCPGFGGFDQSELHRPQPMSPQSTEFAFPDDDWGREQEIVHIGDVATRSRRSLGDAPRRSLFAVARATGAARVLAASRDDVVVSWSRDDGSPQWAKRWDGRPGVCGMGVVPDGSRVVVGLTNGTLLLLDPASGEQQAQVAPAAPHPSREGLGGLVGDVVARLRQSFDPDEKDEDEQRLHGLAAMALSPDGRVAFFVGRAEGGSFEGQHKMRRLLREVPSGRVLWSHTYMVRHNRVPRTPTFSRCGQTLYQIIEGSDRGPQRGQTETVKLDARTGEVLGPVAAPQGASARIMALQALPEGRIAALTDGALLCWSPTHQDDATVLRDERWPCTPPLAVSADGALAACGTSAGELVLWSLLTQRPLSALPLDPLADAPAHLLFCADDDRELLMGTRRGVVHRVDLSRLPRPRGTLTLPARPTAVSWHPRRPLLALGCDDGHAAVLEWDEAADYLEIYRDIAGAAKGRIETVCWSADGRRFRCVCDDGSAAVLPLGGDASAEAKRTDWAEPAQASADGQMEAAIVDMDIVVVGPARA